MPRAAPVAAGRLGGPRALHSPCPLLWPTPACRPALPTLPRRRHQLSLYAHVSKITWQFDAPARVAGTVANPLRAFDFDPAATPNFDIVNALWDLMGTDDA